MPKHWSAGHQISIPRTDPFPKNRPFPFSVFRDARRRHHRRYHRTLLAERNGTRSVRDGARSSAS